MRNEDTDTHIAEWADLIGDSVPDSVQSHEETGEADDPWTDGF
ncbi:hypothetical protein [Halostella litorea]|nr:hypothetical protein [Halostella litorea]